jgi:2-dehydro-3-deoxy-D-arabinonate dehydratase
MRLFQVLDAQGRLCPGALAGAPDRGLADVAIGGQAGFASTLDLLTAADRDGLDLAGWFDEQRRGGVTAAVDWAALEQTGKAGGFTLAIPIVPPEVWGAGVTYRRSADFREEGLGIYDKIYEAPRPELFFKATASRSAGPHQPVGRRKDSAFTAAEPEVCVIVSRGGAILGYTLANDVSAWDIERDNPLYLPQSKVYDGCFSCGPTIVTPDEVADPYGIEVTMLVSRGSTEVFKGSASTSQLKRKLPDLVEWLRKSNDVPTGTILSTGTGIIQPLGSGLEPGDVVVISSPQLGTLSNPVAFV